MVLPEEMRQLAGVPSTGSTLKKALVSVELDEPLPEPEPVDSEGMVTYLG